MLNLPYIINHFGFCLGDNKTIEKMLKKKIQSIYISIGQKMS